MNFLNTHSRIILLKNVNESTAQECLCSWTIHFINYVFIKVAVGVNYVYELCVWFVLYLCSISYDAYMAVTFCKQHNL